MCVLGVVVVVVTLPHSRAPASCLAILGANQAANPPLIPERRTEPTEVLAPCPFPPDNHMFVPIYSEKPRQKNLSHGGQSVSREGLMLTSHLVC